jgi:myo-inositol-hexaphosphate 3-phosphohydrolase
MKTKNIFKIVGLAMIAGLAIHNTGIGLKDYNRGKLSNITLKNIEALAGESVELTAAEKKLCEKQDNVWCEVPIDSSSYHYIAHYKNK